MLDIIERLNDEMYVDAVDDAIHEIENLRQQLKEIKIVSKNLMDCHDKLSKYTWAVKDVDKRNEALDDMQETLSKYPEG